MTFSHNRIKVRINRSFNSAIKLAISKVMFLFFETIIVESPPSWKIWVFFWSDTLEPQIGFSLVETRVDKGGHDCPNMLGYSELYTDPRSLVVAKKENKWSKCVLSLCGPNNAISVLGCFTAHLHFLSQTNLLKDIKTYLKAAANRETELTKKQHELEEKVFRLVSAVKLNY